MPEDIKGIKRRLADNFWALLSRRHPLTRWWWSPGSEASLDLFPEWSPTEFEREAGDWRRLAQETVDIDDEEIQHWGRFARWTAARLFSGSYQDAAEPLRHANNAISLVRLLDPLGHRYQLAEVLASLSGWLERVGGVGASGFWRRTRVQSEASRLLRQISEWGGFQTGLGAGDASTWEEVDRAVRHYVSRVSDNGWTDSESIPWATSAHVFVETWRTLRASMSQEKPIVIRRPLRARDAMASHELERFPSLQEVVVPGLSQWWFRPEGDKAAIFHGGSPDSTLPLAVVLALWHQESGVSPLTWALTHPPHIEGGLQAVAEVVSRLWSPWPPVQVGLLSQWSQRRRSLAVVDAWLWLEAGDPREALNWLCRFVPKDDALATIPWMKSHPGYYVMAYRVSEVLSQAGPAPDWSHWAFQHGPTMPTSLFLSPWPNVQDRDL